MSIGRHIGEEHVRIEAAAVGGRVLRAAGGLPDVLVNIFGQLVGGDDPITALIRRPLQAPDHIVSEDAVAATPVRTLERSLAVTARGQREDRAAQVEQRAVDRLDVGLRRDRAAVAGIGQQHLPLRLDQRAKRVSEIRHRISSLLHVLRIEVVRRQIRHAVDDEAVPGEVDEHPVVGTGHRRQPLFELLLHVGERRLSPHQTVDVLRPEVPTLRTDEHRVHRLGVAGGVAELLVFGKVFVVADADGQGVAARNHYLLLRPGLRLDDVFLHPQVALLLLRRLLSRGEQCRRQRQRQQSRDTVSHRPHL